MQKSARKFHGLHDGFAQAAPMSVSKLRRSGTGRLAMYAFLKQAFGTIRHIVVGVVIAGGLINMSALADQGDIDNVIIMPTPLSDIVDSENPLQKRLEFAIGEAMMDIGILPLAPDFLSVPPVENGRQTDILAVLQTVAAKHTGRLLAVEIGLLTTADPEPHPVPAASVIDIGTGRLVARTSTLPLLEPDDRLEITAAAAALARALARQLEQNGYVLSAAARKPWGGRATEYRLSLEGFDLCERRDLLTTMEKEFPGFLSIDLVKAPNPTFAVYVYRSTATGQRLQKWLEQLMVSYRIAPHASSRILAKDSSIRVQKDRSHKIFSPLCDG